MDSRSDSARDSYRDSRASSECDLRLEPRGDCWPDSPVESHRGSKVSLPRESQSDLQKDLQNESQGDFDGVWRGCPTTATALD